MKKLIGLFFFLSVGGRLSTFLTPILPAAIDLPDRILTKIVWLPVLFLIIFIFWMRRSVYFKKLLDIVEKNTGTLIFIAIFVLVAFISAFFGFNRGASILTAFYYLILCIIPLIVVAFGKEDVDYLYKVISITTVILFIVALAQYLDFAKNQNNGELVKLFGGGGFVPIEFFNIRTEGAGIFLRPSSLMVDPNIYAGFLSIPALFSLDYLRKKKFIIVSSFVLLVSLFSLLLTASRTGILALTAGLVVYGLLRISFKGKSFSFLGLSTFIDSLYKRIVDGLSLSDLSSAYHLEFAKGAIRMFLDRPILGVGVGGYPIYFSRMINSAVTFGTAHSAYLRVISEAGILGLLSFSAVIISFLRKLLLKNSPLLLSIFISILAGNIFYDYFMTPWVWFMLGIFISDVEF